MTDRAFETPEADPFEQIAKNASPGASEDDNDPFAKIAKLGGQPQQEQTSTTGAFVRSAARGVAPAVGSLPAIGAGAEIGAELGLLGGPAAPITVPAGTLIGGGIGAIVGSSAISKVQDWALSKLPDSWREKIGLSDRQQQLDEAEHPIASFFGGITPYALTMRPGATPTTPLPENATALQRILAHPMTARVFGGAAMGGMELGQEKTEGQPTNWAKVAISTGFGMVFNRPTRIGEALTETGARPARAIIGRPEPTVAQANDAKVMGPGVTEQVYQGAHEQDPAAAMTAQETARQEATFTEPQATPDLRATARKMAPETFAHYDDLVEREKTLTNWIAENPSEEMPAAQAHLADTREQIANVAPEIAAAYRRAAEVTGAETAPGVEGNKRFPNMAAMLAEQGQSAAPAAAPGALPPNELTPPRTIEQQRDFIRNDVAQRLIAAGRPQDEAQAAGAVIAARYETRAARFDGKLGTAEDLYRSEGPQIRRAAGGATPASTTPAPSAPSGPASIDNSHTVRSGANSTPDGKVVIDHRIPEFSPTLKDKNGNPANLHKYLAIHETKEADAEARGMNYDDAHTKVATPAERAAVEADGVDWNGYTKEIDGYLSAIEHEPNTNPYPGKLHVDPEAAIGHHRSDNKTETETPEAEVTTPRRRNGPASRDPNTFSLLEFLASRGGIRSDDPLASDLKQSFGGGNKFIPGFGQLIRSPKELSTAARQGGRHAPMTLDHALEAAVEAGYIEEPGNVTGGAARRNISDLLEAIDNEARGQRVYRQGYQREGVSTEQEQFEHERNTLLTELSEHVKENGGVPLTDAEKSRAVELWHKEGLHEAPAILERLALEADNSAIEQGQPQRGEAIAGWDIPDDAAGAQGESAAAIPSRPEQPGGAAAHGGGERHGEANPSQVWQRFVADKSEREQRTRIATGYNDFRTKSGLAPIRARSSQEWTPGNVVDVGFVKNLLIAKENADGSFTLLAKPNSAGQSQSYNVRPQEGLVKEDKINFLEATRDLKTAAESKELESEYFQRKPRDLIAEREAEGQQQLPGAERISEAEQAQRGANAPLKSSVEQKPMDEGLFGDAKNQGELFQHTLGSVKQDERGIYRIITLSKHADASTFIHESGHMFLEEIMRDAAHEAAPDALKDDAKTVQDWLGVSSPDDIATRHHEKFARGFEQYLREGVAPSPGLAGVFAKFRDWLLRIYQTIRSLGPEISPDIRNVFDRLLATEPQRTVIAPDLVKRPTLQDIHESDATLTEPHQAEPARDRVVAETERFIADLPPELTAEHGNAAARAEPTAGAEPAAEGGPGPGQPGQVEPDRGGPGTESPGGAGGPQRGAELPGGADAGTKGAGVPSPAERAGEQSRSDATLSDKPLAPRPATLLGPEESPLVDKAGNIRLDNINTSEDVKQALRDAARENNDFIGDRRGVVTDGQVLDLANALGMTADDLLKRRIGQAFNAEEIKAAEKLVAQSSITVAAAMKKAAVGTDEDVMAYAAAKARHQLIQAQFSGVTAEAGRATRALRKTQEFWSQEALAADAFLREQATREATGKTLFQLRNEAHLGAALQTPQQVSKFMQDAQKYTFGRMVLEYWINGLISGPATHITYAMGNTILALQKAGPETAAAAFIGQFRKAMGREGETVRMGEVAAQLAAGGRAFAPSLKAALDAFHTGVTTLLPGEKGSQSALPFQPGSEFVEAAVLNEAATFHDALTSAFGILQGIKDGFRAGGALTEDRPTFGLQYSHLGSIPEIRIGGAIAPIGTLARAPSRAVAAIHSFWRSTNYSMEKAADAYRTAANEGLTGEAFDARVGEIRQNPSQEQMERYTGVSNELTLMGQGGEFTKALSKLTNTPIFGLPIFKFIDPFVHISSNIIEQSIIERTPVGILSPEIRADLMGKNGNVAQDTAMARMLVGTAYAVAIGGMAAEGYVSGSGPSDPRQAAIWRLAGNQAHSVRIGDTWYAVGKLGPMGMLMGIGADLYDVAHQASQGEMLQAASLLQHAITQNVLDESFMRGPSDLIKAIDDPGRYGQSYIRNWLSSFVPYSVGMAQMDRAADPYSRQARSVMDAIKQKIPGLSEQLLPRRDIWGEPMPNRDALLAPGVTAIYESRMSRDPVNLALLNLGIAPAQLERKIRNVQLTDDQYDDFQRIAGRMTKMRLDAIVRSPDFAMWPNHIRHDVISEVITQSREAARGLMMAKNPQIVRDATAARLKKLRGE